MEKREFVFEDKNRKLLNLAGVWTSDILSGKTVFMRVNFDDVSNSQGQCPSCDSYTEDEHEQTEIIW